MTQRETIILGAGVTGLGAGMASGLPVFEAREVGGGICGSYYVRPGTSARLPTAMDTDAYRFEYGGGHWIFGGDPSVLHLIDTLAPTKSYRRHSAVFFPDTGLYVPYPLQHHLSYLDKKTARKALSEIAAAPRTAVRTMAEWLEQSFGPSLMELFFAPFHELYTAGLWKQVVPQDGYKSPADLSLVMQGARQHTPQVGYNATFRYPTEGLNVLVGEMAKRCEVQYDNKVIRIDLDAKTIEFSNGRTLAYHRVVSTLPLNQMCALSGLTLDVPADPFTSVLVLNIGGVKGRRCPEHHWVYVPRSRAGFHRVGFYNNVDTSFLPRPVRGAGEHVSLYVEKAYRGGEQPSRAEVASLSAGIVEELREWEFLAEAEVVDPTWIEVAYTWSRPGSVWKQAALSALAARDIHQVGRYGRWVFQGIADSIRDGLVAGAAYAGSPPSRAAIRPADWQASRTYV